MRQNATVAVFVAQQFTTVHIIRPHEHTFLHGLPVSLSDLLAQTRNKKITSIL
jgi:hypothetical protein